MKTIFIILFIGFIITGCNYGHEGSSYTLILSDQTEDYFPIISYNEWKSGCSLATNINSGDAIRFRAISDVGFAKPVEFSIAEVSNKFLSNTVTRRDDTARYFKNVNEGFLSFSKSHSTKTSSIIFKVIVEELNRLADIKSDEKVALIYSDLKENSELADFYSKSTLRKIEDSTEVMVEQFITRYPIKNLNGITVYLNYIPKDNSDSEVFEIISKFYTTLLTSYNAKVLINEPLNSIK